MADDDDPDAIAATANRMAAEGMPDRISEPSIPTTYSNVLMVGDSVMYLSKNYIESEMPGIVVDASPGRTLEKGGRTEGWNENDGVFDHLREVSPDYDYYIIGTGNNDDDGLWDYDAEWIVETIGPDKQIFFVTQYMSDKEFSTFVTNDTIDVMMQLHPNVHAIRWSEFAEQDPDYYLDDAVHPADPLGRIAYARLIRETLDAYEDGSLAAEEQAIRDAGEYSSWDEYYADTYEDEDEDEGEEE